MLRIIIVGILALGVFFLFQVKTSDSSKQFPKQTELNSTAKINTNRADVTAVSTKVDVEQKYSTKIEIEKDTNGNPKGLYGKFKLQKAPGQVNADALYGFVHEVAPILGISDPTTLKLFNERSAPLGQVTTFVQTVNGFRVEGGLVDVHQNDGGLVIGVDSAYNNGIDGIPVSPAIPIEKAIEIVSQEFKVDPKIIDVTQIEPVVTRVPDAPAFGLFWRIPVQDLSKGPSGVFTARVNTQTGAAYKGGTTSN